MHDGDNPWYFVTLPFDQADQIDEITANVQRGFGSVRVEVTIGSSVWRTSLFPDKKRGSYVLPIKKAVRLGEALQVGTFVQISLDLVDVASN